MWSGRERWCGTALMTLRERERAEGKPLGLLLYIERQWENNLTLEMNRNEVQDLYWTMSNLRRTEITSRIIRKRILTNKEGCTRSIHTDIQWPVHPHGTGLRSDWAVLVGWKTRCVTMTRIWPQTMHRRQEVLRFLQGNRTERIKA